MPDQAPIPVVIVDTTTTFDDLLLRRIQWMQVLALCAKAGIRVVMPEVVVRESVRHWTRQSEQALSKARSETQKLNTAFGVDAGDGPASALLDAAAHDQYVRDRLAKVGAEVPDLPAASTEALVTRDLADRKPFSSTGKGFRDALNWETILELIADEPDLGQVYWVSKNTEDFTDGKGKLHPDLVTDLDTPERVIWVATLGELLKRPELSGLVPGIEGTEEELNAFLASAPVTVPGAGDAPTTADLVRESLIDAAELLVGRDIDGGFAIDDPDPAFAELEIPSMIESTTIDYVQADPDTAIWQVYETFNDTTLLLEGSIDALLVIEGFMSKGDAVDLPAGVTLRDWDWNNHNSRVSYECQATLTFQLRVEEGVGVDYVDFESATPAWSA